MAQQDLTPAAAGGKNTLQITTQYPAERFNLLVPMQTVAEIAEIHKPVMNVVKISTNLADKEIYLQDKSKKDAAKLQKPSEQDKCHKNQATLKL